MIHHLQCIAVAFGANTGVGAVGVAVVVAVVDTETRGERAGIDVGLQLWDSHRRRHTGVVIGVRDGESVDESVSGDESRFLRSLEVCQGAQSINRSNLKSLAVTRAGA